MSKMDLMRWLVTVWFPVTVLSGCGGASKAGRDKALAGLESILSLSEPSNVRPAPGNQIQVLCQDKDGLGLLEDLAERHELFAFDPESKDYLLIWSGREHGPQTLFTKEGIAELPPQVRLTSVRIEVGQVKIQFSTSSNENDRIAVVRFFGLQPGMDYRVDIDLSGLGEADLLDVWKSGTPVDEPESSRGTQPSPGNEVPRSTPEK